MAGIRSTDEGHFAPNSSSTNQAAAKAVTAKHPTEAATTESFPSPTCEDHTASRSSTPDSQSPLSDGATHLSDLTDIDKAIAKFAKEVSAAYGADIEPIPDGEIHRFDNPEKRTGNKDFWYFLIPEGTYGVHGNWGTDEKHYWFIDALQMISDEEVANNARRIEAAKNQRLRHPLGDQERVARKAEKMAEEPSTIPDQPDLDNTTIDGTVAHAGNYTDSIDIDAATEQFAEAISMNLGADVVPFPDGEIHRFDDPGKRPGTKNCWLYFDPSGTYGIYGNWRTEERYDWYMDDFEAISDEKLAKILENVEAAKQHRAQQRLNDQERSAQKAERLINSAKPADSTHAYLQKKWIPSANARQIGDTLLIPLRNIDGDIRNMQRISPSGKKRFLKNGEVTGNFSLIGADELPADGSLIVCEGWATGVSLHADHGWPVAAALTAGNLHNTCTKLRQQLPDSVTIIVAADDDRHKQGNSGLSKAMGASDAIGADLIRPDFPCADCDCTDFNDVAVCQKQKMSDKAENTQKGPPSITREPSKNQPIPLTSALPPVKPLTADMLPDSIGGFVTDVAMRLQIPIDYVAVCAIPVAAGIVGAKRRIHPKRHDDWLVTPTVFAGMVGGPSTMKSAARKAALKPLYELEKEMAEAHSEALESYQWSAELAEADFKQLKKDATALYSENPDKAVQLLKESAFTDQPPTRHRYIINDATIEKLGELLRENPNGMLQDRDELSGFLWKLSREEYQADRSFYLECAEGSNRFTCDRIGRGTIEIENCVLSICGGIQPSKIAPIIRSAMTGVADDGLIQRFQLAVWPDVPKGWKWIDQAPDPVAYSRYRSALRQLHELPVETVETDSHLRFSKSAQVSFIAWMEQLHAALRSDDVHPVMQSHLAKMPKTVAGLALLFELLDGGRKRVHKTATARAIKWAEYLSSHAARLYSLSSNQAMTGAKLILKRRDKLPPTFRARHVYRKNWVGLSSTQDVADALDCLVDHRYLSEMQIPKSPAGGRPTNQYRWNPALSKKS